MACSCFTTLFYVYIVFHDMWCLCCCFYVLGLDFCISEFFFNQQKCKSSLFSVATRLSIVLCFAWVTSCVCKSYAQGASHECSCSLVYFWQRGHLYYFSFFFSLSFFLKLVHAFSLLLE